MQRVGLRGASLMQNALNRPFLHVSRCTIGRVQTFYSREHPNVPEEFKSSIDPHHELPRYFEVELEGSTVDEHLANWKEGNELFYGPERDMVNYPPLKMELTHPTTRLGIFPDTWFTSFYKKTGFLGPYTFSGSVLIWLLSKEILAPHDCLTEMVIMFTITFPLVAIKYVGSKFDFREAIEKQGDIIEEQLTGVIKEQMADMPAGVEKLDSAVKMHESGKYIYEAKKENVALQLEARYRERMNTVHDEVKKRLDYQLALEETQKKCEHEHMVNWITSNVRKSITPKLEKEAIANCIANLKQLSKNQATA